MGGEADWSVFLWFGSTALLVDRGDELLFLELWDNSSFKGLLLYAVYFLLKNDNLAVHTAVRMDLHNAMRRDFEELHCLKLYYRYKAHM